MAVLSAFDFSIEPAATAQVYTEFFFSVELDESFSETESIRVLFWPVGEVQTWVTLVRNPETGSFEASLEMPASVRSGMYEVRQVRAISNDGDEVQIDTYAIEAAGFSASAQLTNAFADNSDPTVSDIAALPAQTAPDGTITIAATFRADDASGSGLDTGDMLVEFKTPGGASILASAVALPDGSFQASATLPATASSGTYSVNTVRVADQSLNLALVYSDVTFQVENPNADNTPPQLDFFDATATLSGDATTFEYAMRWSDDIGCDRVYLRVWLPSGSQEDRWIYPDETGSASGTIILDGSFGASGYGIELTGYDAAGNTTKLNSTQIEALGFPGTVYAAGDTNTSAVDDVVILNSVSLGGPIERIDGADGMDTLDARNIYAGSIWMMWRTYDNDANFAGYNTIQVADYELVNFEVIYGSNLGANRFFLPDYDRAVTLHGGAYDDFFFGSWDHADTFYGNAGNDDFLIQAGDSGYGGNGDDVFELSLNFDGPAGHIDGGAGSDLLEASFAAHVDLEAGFARHGSGVYSTISNVENVEVFAMDGWSTRVSGDVNDNHLFVGRHDDGTVGVFFDGRGGNDVLDGSAGQDELFGGLGDDTIRGGAEADRLFGNGGQDILDGGSGDDHIDGGYGNDTLRFETATTGVQVFLWKDGVAQDTLGAGVDTLISIENVEGTAWADLLAGNEGVNILSGNDGDDLLKGLGGNDALKGGLGNDQLVGGLGNDILRGGAGADVLIGDTGVDVMFGDDGDDYLKGANGIDRLYGGFGNDVIEGGNQTDYLFGQQGNDILLGDDGDDYIQGNAGTDTLNGGAGNDRLDGNNGNDILRGGDGNDILIGSWGVDTMTGGAGADSFIFKTGHTGKLMTTADTILDFSSAEGDVIDLSQIDAIAGGANDAFTFIGDAAFSGTAGELRFFLSDGRAYVAGDTDGDGVGDLFIALDGVTDLTASDFVL